MCVRAARLRSETWRTSCARRYLLMKKEKCSSLSRLPLLLIFPFNFIIFTHLLQHMNTHTHTSLLLSRPARSTLRPTAACVGRAWRTRGIRCTTDATATSGTSTAACSPRSSAACSPSPALLCVPHPAFRPPHPATPMPLRFSRPPPYPQASHRHLAMSLTGRRRPPMIS